MMKHRRVRQVAVLLLAALILIGVGMASLAIRWMGKQPDGSFLVSSGQRIEGGAIAFTGRPSDLALHPSGKFFAVLNKSSVFIADANGARPETEFKIPNANAGFRGLVWSPNGSRLYASTDKGPIREFKFENGKFRLGADVYLQPRKEEGNPVPGGLVITKDGSRLFAAAANLNAVVEIDLAKNAIVRTYPVENLPFEPRLSEDEKTIVVSNWGGHVARLGEPTSKSEKLDIAVDERNTATSGTVSLIDRQTGATRHVEVGIHPTSLVIQGGKAYVANAMSDSISEIDLLQAKVTRTIPMTWGKLMLLGSMPNALAIQGETLYVADGGDNALAEVDLPTGKVKGFRPAGYFPIALALAPDGKTAFVLNTKGNGSVSKTSIGKVGNAHDFQGTISVLDLNKDLAAQTEVVALDNRWNANPTRPPLKVYNGAIKHVLYIIKENRTYDEIYGDMNIGNGDPKLCSLGEKVMPNHRKIAREFTLFDNGYVSGTNSADGHNWSTQAMANEYLEHFYVGYSRTYPCEGEDPMSISNAGAIWDAALRKKKTLRVWGEFCDEEKALVDPSPKDWFEVWEDRKKGTNKFQFRATCDVPSLRPYINPNVLYWPLLQSDQQRADIFIREYEEFSKKDTIPELMIMSLPCDHAEGTSTKYPTPRAMMADNDLALGRVVEVVSRSPQWKETCIFVIEDDAQAGPDHVDGHRTAFMAISPYNKRKFIDSSFYTTVSMIRSIEMMLGLDPMNKFDALADPMIECFTDNLNLAPYVPVKNNVPLDERNPSRKNMGALDRYWLDKTESLDWSHLDAADPYWLNRINWYSIYKGTRPYPTRPGEAPGQGEADDDDDER
jgi:DNA-binding beta-propeller fold protein YncE